MAACSHVREHSCIVRDTAFLTWLRRGQVATQIAIPAQLDNPVAPPHRRPIRNVEADELGEEPVGDTLPHLHNLMND